MSVNRYLRHMATPSYIERGSVPITPKTDPQGPGVGPGPYEPGFPGRSGIAGIGVPAGVIGGPGGRKGYFGLPSIGGHFTSPPALPVHGRGVASYDDWDEYWRKLQQQRGMA